MTLARRVRGLLRLRYLSSVPQAAPEIAMKSSVILAIVTLLLAACGSENAPVDNKAAVPDTELSGNRGEVLSSIQVPSYTYIEVRTDGQILWLAGNPVEVEDGEIITWVPSMVMHDFQSNTLNRTFEEIVFVASVNQGAAAAPAVAQMEPEPAVTQAKPESNSGTVRSTEDAAGYTYIEVETDAGNIVWLAAPQTEVAVADRVAWQGGSVMADFSSPSLGKTFPEILFVNGVTIDE